METIKTYLNNMFSAYKRSPQLDKIRQEMLANMGEKYEELKAQGHSENEAIGIVISEFGNIEELIEELGANAGASSSPDGAPVYTATQEQVESYIQSARKYGNLTALGVMIIILSPCFLIASPLLAKTEQELVGYGTAGIVTILLLVAVAVGLFIYGGTKMEVFKPLEEEYHIPLGLQETLYMEKERVSTAHIVTLIAGISFCILSAVPLLTSIFWTEDMQTLAVVLLLCLVAVGVYLIILSASMVDGYKKLLKLDDYSPKQKKENSISGAIGGILWPVALCIFLYFGFSHKAWSLCWIVFPIAGGLQALISAIVHAAQSGSSR